jgi:hypothetical protein
VNVPDYLRFMRHTRVGLECWEWVGAKTRWGYGSFRLGGRSVLAHRAAWMIFRSEDPGPLCVCHTCDNPACVNHIHMFLGTNADNVADRHAKGRSRGGSSRGANHPGSKLTDEQVQAIRAASGSQRAIGARFGVHQAHVSQIRQGKRWKS